MIKLYLISFILGVAGAAAVQLMGKKLGLIDRPNHRSSHAQPTPKGGGIGILAAFLAAAFITGQPIIFAITASVISLLGLYGDRIDISPKMRLLVQFLCAVFTVIVFTDSSSSNIFALLLLPLWLLFIVGTANFYNFMDGINGIAGITGITAFGLMALFLHLENTASTISPLAIALACGCLGFLPFNMPKARVFMGDVGSILLGFVFGVFVYNLTTTPLDFLVFASLLFPFYIDELSTMIIRIKNGERLTEAHRKHLYQILVNENNIAHWQVSLLYGVVQCGIGLSTFTLKEKGIIAVLLFLLLASMSFVALSLIVRQRTRMKL